MKLARLAVFALVGCDKWQRYDFELTPVGNEPHGRFAVGLDQPGTVAIGHVFLQPGGWGRYQDLPVRRDVGQLFTTGRTE